MRVPPVIQCHESGFSPGAGEIGPFGRYVANTPSDNAIYVEPSEASFWLFRVRNVRIAYDLTVNGDGASNYAIQGEFGITSTAANEGELVLTSAVVLGGGVGGVSDPWQISVSEPFFGTSDDGTSWHMRPEVFFSGVELITRTATPSHDNQFVSFYAPYMDTPTSAVVRFFGEDELNGRSYNRELLFCRGTGSATLSGFVTIEATGFWPYAVDDDAENAPLYSAETGAPRSSWYKWFGAGPAPQ